MHRRGIDGPLDEYRRQLADLHRRTDWEHGPASRPDPDWEAHDSEQALAARALLDAITRRLNGRGV